KAPPTPQVAEPEETPVSEPQEEVPALPSPDADKKKKPAEAKPQATAPRETRPEEGPAGTAPGETGDQLGRRGGPQGNPLGTTAFGSEVGSLDNPDFTYAYYLDRLLSLIDAQWLRPPMGSGVKAVISFNINRDGSMSELRVEQSSGYNSFDLAALRAVQNAAPFPPLPRAYKHDDLGVHLIVR
ncbi:MAG TPA: TonB family protein, partial [Thermoanaerobaculia bacterium]|nr:TonB family protein [Thermoanaerobaculia bacterium]